LAPENLPAIFCFWRKKIFCPAAFCEVIHMPVSCRVHIRLVCCGQRNRK